MHGWQQCPFLHFSLSQYSKDYGNETGTDIPSHTMATTLPGEMINAHRRAMLTMYQSQQHNPR